MRKIVLITAMISAPIWAVKSGVIPLQVGGNIKSTEKTYSFSQVFRSVGALICCVPLTAVSCVNDIVEPVRSCLNIRTYAKEKAICEGCSLCDCCCSITGETVAELSGTICCKESKDN